MRLKLILAYDGASFAGWQSQAHTNTIQDVLEKTLSEIAGRRIIVHGAGRTDAGVHALGQCAHIDLTPVSKKMEKPERWLQSLNGLLPATIRVLKIEPVDTNFHARFTPHLKTYRYHLWHDTILPPLLYNRAWHIHGPLDIKILEQLATALVGTHDFRGFTARSRASDENTRLLSKFADGDEVPGVDGAQQLSVHEVLEGASTGATPQFATSVEFRKKSTVRKLDSVKVTSRGKEIRLTFQGKGFLYHMVRMLVGSMVHVARGKSNSEEFLHRLQAATHSVTPRTAPAGGLYLVKICYKL